MEMGIVRNHLQRQLGKLVVGRADEPFAELARSAAKQLVRMHPQSVSQMGDCE